MSHHGVELTVAMYNACLETFSSSGGSRSDTTNLTTRSILAQLENVSGLEDVNRIKQVLIKRGDFDKGPVLIRIINAIVSVRGGNLYLALFARNPRVMRKAERDLEVREALFCAFLKTGLARQAKELITLESPMKIKRIFSALLNAPLVSIPAKIDLVYSLMGNSPRHRDAIFYCKLFRDLRYAKGLDLYSCQENMPHKVRIVLVQGYIRARAWVSARRELEKLSDVGVCIDVVLRELKRDGDVSTEVLELLPFNRAKDAEFGIVQERIESGLGEFGGKEVGYAYATVYCELLENVRESRDVDRALDQLQNL